MKKLLLLSALIISFNLRADLLGFCFPKTTNLQKARSYIQSILLPSEAVYPRASLNCLEVEAKSHRRGLIDKFLSVKFNITKRYNPGLPGGNISEFSANSSRCRIELTRIGKDNSRTRSLDLGRKNDIRERKNKKITTRKSQLLLTSGRPGRLRLDDRDLHVSCMARGQSNFELDFSLDSRRSSVSTAVTLKRGQKLNLADIVDDLDNKNREISLRKGISYSKTKGKSKARFEIQVK